MSSNDRMPLDKCKVYTPRDLADAIVRSLEPDPRSKWLEPSVGKGVFLDSLCGFGITRSQICAIDVDPTKYETDRLAQTMRGIDFLEWHRTLQDRFDRIVGNPPYIPLSRLDTQSKKIACSIRIPGSDMTVPQTSNTWFAFLCGCMRLLKIGGNLSLILPAAWEFADYAESLRGSIHEYFRELITLRSRKPLFEEVQEGSVIIVGKGFKEMNQAHHYIKCSDKTDVVNKLNDLANNHHIDRRKPDRKSDDPGSGVRLGDLLEIRLGGVTGQAKYFLLTEDQRKRNRLPEEALIPVLSRSKHLQNAVIIRRHWNTLLSRHERVWLFSPRNSVLELPDVVDYLNRLPENGGCDLRRYKIRSRSPWYQTPLPKNVDGFMSGMTRLGPWICLNKMKDLNATNTLYVVKFKDNINFAAKCAISLALLTSNVRTELHKRRRHYADGLMKHEPGDLLSIKIQLTENVSGAVEAYTSAIKSLLEGKIEHASSLADKYICNNLKN